MMLALAFVVVFVTWHVQAAVIPTATGRGGSKPEDEEFPAAVDDAERELTHLLTPEEDSYDSDHISYFDNTPENAEAGVDELASEEDRYLNGINKLLADTEDSEGEITPDGKTWSSEDIERAETLPQQESLDDLEPSSPSDDITNEEGDDMNDIHVEARASLKVPGFPDIKVVELNETLYLNSTLNNDVVSKWSAFVIGDVLLFYCAQISPRICYW